LSLQEKLQPLQLWAQYLRSQGRSEALGGEDLRQPHAWFFTSRLVPAIIGHVDDRREALSGRLYKHLRNEPFRAVLPRTRSGWQGDPP
jgi:hypothetical protein